MFREMWRRIILARETRRPETARCQLHAEIALQRNEIARQSAEIERLREENRALLNSILGVAGIPPIRPARSTHAAREFAGSALLDTTDAAQVFGPEGASENDTEKSLGPEAPSYMKSKMKTEKFPAQGHSESSTQPVEEENPPQRRLPGEQAGPAERGGIATRFRTPPPTPAAENEPSGTPAHSPNANEAGTHPLDCPVHSDADARPRNDSHLSHDAAHTRRAVDASSRMRSIVAPLRRRSWHQITQALELESARKSVASD